MRPLFVGKAMVLGLGLHGSLTLAALGVLLDRGFSLFGIASWVRAAARPELSLGLTYGLFALVGEFGIR
jgi:hypothetical protein